MHSRAKTHVPTGLSRIAAVDIGPLVLLQDTFHHAALPLLPTILRDTGNKNLSFCVAALERGASHYSELATQFPGNGDRFFVEGSVLASTVKENFTADVLDSIIKALAHAPPASVVLIIDSVTSLFLHGVEGHTAVGFFRRLLSTFCCVVFIVHKECHEAAFLDSLKYAASASITVGRPTDKKFVGSAETVVKRASGKVRLALEDFRFRADGSVEVSTPVPKQKVVETPADLDPQARAAAVMAAELTPEQKAAKDAVQLPYQHTAEESDEIFLQGAAQEEEDDPDADLDV